MPAAKVAAPEPVSVAPAVPELDDAVAAAPEEAEATAESPPVEAPVQPSRVTTIDIEDALPDDDDIVPVHTARHETAIEGAEDEDLLEIAYRDVAKATVEAPGVEDSEGAAESHPATPPKPKLFDEDSGEAAA